MPAGLEVITGSVTNAGATFTALTMSGTDSNTVRNFPFSANAQILNQWALGATAGEIRTRSPRLHDNTQGIRLSYAASTPTTLWPNYLQQQLEAQDSLTLEQTGGSSETDMFSTLVYYSDLPGTAARLYSWAAIMPRIVHVMGCEISFNTAGTAGAYGVATAINATNDNFKANTDYAVLGYLTNTAICTVTIKSADTSNLRVGGPGTNNKIDTRNWFIRISEESNLPLIPVFNAANKNNTIVEYVHSGTGTTVVTNFILAQLTT